MGADLIAFPEVYPQIVVPEWYHHSEPAEGGTLAGVRELGQALQDV